MRLRQALKDYFNRTPVQGEAIKTRDAYRHLFASPDGERVLNDLIVRYQVFATRELSPFDQGRRSVVIDVLAVLENPALLKSHEILPKE